MGLLKKIKEQALNSANLDILKEQAKQKYAELQQQIGGAVVEDSAQQSSESGAMSSFERLHHALTDLDKEKSLGISAFGYGINLSSGESKMDRKIQLITTFPIPTDKDDLVDFLGMASSLTRKPSFMKSLTKLEQAWYDKCRQIVEKVRLVMKDDVDTLEKIEFYAKKLGL